MKNLLLGLVFLGCSSIAVAQSFSIQGLGNNTCGEAMQNISRMGSAAETEYADWVGGFITGSSYAFSVTKNVDVIVGVGLSFDTLTALFKNKCAQDAQKRVIQAAIEINHELGKRQQQ